MLRIQLLPAHHGDCLLIEYGSAASLRRVLIDGGTPDSFAAVDERLASIGPTVDVELWVVTHVDEDHIGGTLKQLVENATRVAPKEVWFNAYRHLFPPDMQGPGQGEGLTTAIENAQFAWNSAFEDLEVSVVVPDDGPLPVIQLAGGATITLLSPTWPKLEKLRPVWLDACRKAKLIAGQGAEPEDVLGKRPPPANLTPSKVRTLAKDKFKIDGSRPNGSSIAFIFEHDEKSILLTGDAHPDALLASLKRYSSMPIIVDAWKMSHHGSRRNLNDALLAHVETPHYLFSSDGGTFGHPDPETIARILVKKEESDKTLHFNYDTDYTRPWSDVDLTEEFGYTAEYGDDGHLQLDL